MLKKIGKKYCTVVMQQKCLAFTQWQFWCHYPCHRIWPPQELLWLLWKYSEAQLTLCIIHTAMQNKTSALSNRNLELSHCFRTVCRPLQKHTQTQIAVFPRCHPEHNWIWHSSVYFSWWPSRPTKWYQEMTRGIPEKAKWWAQDYSLNISMFALTAHQMIKLRGPL